MKLERLQLRIEGELKKRFKKYAQRKGGMSYLVQKFVRDLLDDERKEDGQELEGRTGDRETHHRL